MILGVDELLGACCVEVEGTFELELGVVKTAEVVAFRDDEILLGF